MRKLIESTFVTLGGDIGAPQEWGPPYLSGPEQDAYSRVGADVAAQVAELKRQPGKYLLKYGTGALDRVLLASGLLDEVRIWIVPVTTGPGQPLFEGVDGVGLTLTQTRTFASGVVLLTYVPDRR